MLREVIEELPKGIDSNIGERGIKLSGGQRQRIAIARVILKNPDLIIFDEATTSLDKENESIIATLIKKISKGKTIIIITHNIHPFQFADNIYELKIGIKIKRKSSKYIRITKCYQFFTPMGANWLKGNHFFS